MGLEDGIPWHSGVLHWRHCLWEFWLNWFSSARHMPIAEYTPVNHCFSLVGGKVFLVSRMNPVPFLSHSPALPGRVAQIVKQTNKLDSWIFFLAINRAEFGLWPSVGLCCVWFANIWMISGYSGNCPCTLKASQIFRYLNIHDSLPFYFKHHSSCPIRQQKQHHVTEVTNCITREHKTQFCICLTTCFVSSPVHWNGITHEAVPQVV